MNRIKRERTLQKLLLFLRLSARAPLHRHFNPSKSVITWPRHAARGMSFILLNSARQAFLCGFDTPSLAAQDGQRLPSYFNIQWAVPVRSVKED
jgi:hypothetical protein